MEKVLHCECGFEARAANEEGLVAEVRRHASEPHAMAPTHYEALLTFRAELNEGTPLAIPPKRQGLGLQFSGEPLALGSRVRSERPQTATKPKARSRAA